ncbi:hypothetical protein [Mesorhizobium kowhaii]|uniref:hypothetical protein n=1 Tax=Mesorhizobium kowhaii TaxID=1300272 RepID=UPI00142D9E7E|nr:hypothetical protein [Mesorhizobium kowhaii]
MAADKEVDKKLEEELQNQIKLLEKLQVGTVEAIKRANTKLGEVQAGNSREQVFPRKK